MQSFLLAVVNAPQDILYVLLLAAGFMWLVLGTLTLRWSCSAVNLITVAKPAAGSIEQGGTVPIAPMSPDISSATGMVMLNALILGGFWFLTYCYQLAMHAMGGKLLPIQQIGLTVVAFLIAPAVMVAVNRKALRTTWLRAFVVTAGYLLMTSLLVATAYFLLLFGLGR